MSTPDVLLLEQGHDDVSKVWSPISPIDWMTNVLKLRRSAHNYFIFINHLTLWCFFDSYWAKGKLD